MKENKTFAIIGLGTFGFELCKELSSYGAKVIAIDNDEKRLTQVQDYTIQTIHMDSTDEYSLKQTSFENVDIAIVAIAEDIEASIISSALLKRQEIPYIIARATSSIHNDVLKQIGVDEIINVEIEEGKRIASRLTHPNIIDLVPISQSQVLAEVLLPKQYTGMTLQQIGLRKDFEINAVSIKRLIIDVDSIGNPIKSEEIIFPKADEILHSNDILILVGSKDKIQQFEDK